MSGCLAIWAGATTHASLSPAAISADRSGSRGLPPSLPAAARRRLLFCTVSAAGAPVSLSCFYVSTFRIGRASQHVYDALTGGALEALLCRKADVPGLSCGGGATGEAAMLRDGGQRGGKVNGTHTMRKPSVA